MQAAFDGGFWWAVAQEDGVQLIAQLAQGRCRVQITRRRGREHAVENLKHERENSVLLYHGTELEVLLMLP